MAQGMAQPMSLTNSSGQNFYSPTGIIGAKMAENPGQVAKFRSENKLGDVFGYDPYMTKLVAKTEGRDWDASDPYGLYAEKAAADQAKLEASPAYKGSTTVSTISNAQAATQQPSTNTRTPQRVRPIRSSLKTSYGTKQIPTSSSLSSGMGLNVPN
jgi:hypothetical protein